MTLTTEHALRAVLNQRFGGLLRKGAHDQDGDVCAIELRAAVLGLDWTDNPQRTRDFDYRCINDMEVTDALRTQWMLPVMAAYAGSLDWTTDRQQQVAERLIIRTVQRIIAELPDLPEEIRQQCRQVETLPACVAPAMAAWASVAPARAAMAAAMAAWASGAAARAARAEVGMAEVERIFVDTCQVWLDAVAGRHA